MSNVPAAQQVLGILRYLARQPRPVPASAIARDLGLPRSTTYHLLNELVDAGFVVHLADERRYGLGVSAYELGTGYLRQEPMQRLARMPLAGLTAQTGHSAHLAVMHGREVLYVIEERAPGRAPLVTDVGVRLPAQLTASGRAMLAALPAAAVRALFPGPAAFVLRNERGPRTLRQLRYLLAEVRGRGYATERGEVSEGFSSVAAAVLDHGGHPVASVALTFPDAEADAALMSRFASLITQAAAEITRRIGGSLPAGGRKALCPMGCLVSQTPAPLPGTSASRRIAQNHAEKETRMTTSVPSLSIDAADAAALAAFWSEVLDRRSARTRPPRTAGGSMSPATRAATRGQ